MSRLRVAVIGAGHLGKIHARLLRQLDEVELVGVAEPSPSAQKEIIEALNVPVFSDYRKLIDDIDAAIVATPTRLHHGITADLLENGIHALVEKPLTDDPATARELVRLAEARNCVLSVGHVEQFNFAIRHAVKTVGRPRHVQASRTSGFTYRSVDIGVVFDLMIHDIDLVNSLFPGKLVDCRATGTSVLGGHEDIAHAWLTFSCGSTAHLTASRVHFQATRNFQVFGDLGYAIADLANGTVSTVQYPDWVTDGSFDFMAADPDQQAYIRENLFRDVLPKTEESPESVNAILEEQRNWVAAIRQGQRLRNTGENGCAAVEIADAILKQIDQATWSRHVGRRPSLPLPWAAESTPVVTTKQLPPEQLRKKRAA